MSLFTRSVSRMYQPEDRPIKVLQFGGDIFMRGFFDWMLQRANNRSNFNGNAVIVDDTDDGLLLEEQKSVFTVVTRGKDGAKALVVDSVSDTVDPLSAYDRFLTYADSPDLRFVVSGTADIRFEEGQSLKEPQNFPARATALLFRRFCQDLPGLVFLPCEEIANNGDVLKECILQYAEDWGLGIDFQNWINMKSIFCSTMADRLVPCLLEENSFHLDYRDKLAVEAEPYHQWVIAGPEEIRHELPFQDAGLNLLWTEDILPYFTMKERLFDGVCTLSAGYALLHEIDTVTDYLSTPRLARLTNAAVFDELLLTVNRSQEEKEAYALDTLTRLQNPCFTWHWNSIAAYGISHFCIQVLPAIREYTDAYGKLPKHLVFSLYCLLKAYRTLDIEDEPELRRTVRAATFAELLADTELWGEDLSYLLPEMERYEARVNEV